MGGEGTVFHKIMRREIPAEIVFEDERAFCFRDINPIAPTHILIVPKLTLPSLNEATEGVEGLLGHLLLLAAELAREEGIDDTGYRVVINTGEGGGQSVFQLHLHLIGGREFRWPPG